MSIDQLIRLVARKHERRTRLPVGVDIGGLPPIRATHLKCASTGSRRRASPTLYITPGARARPFRQIRTRHSDRSRSPTGGPGMAATKRQRGNSRRTGPRGLRDRIEALGGHFTIESRPDLVRVYRPDLPLRRNVRWVALSQLRPLTIIPCFSKGCGVHSGDQRHHDRRRGRLRGGCVTDRFRCRPNILLLDIDIPAAVSTLPVTFPQIARWSGSSC